MNSPIRIVHIEDGPFRKILEPAFAKGFARPNTLFESRPDFSLLRQELTTGNLASVYILDNEIAGDPQRKQGGEFATEIVDRSIELNRPTLVTTLLCSNPSAMRYMYGEALDQRNIPTFFKTSQAPICGFWIARCIDESRIIPMDEYLKMEGISLPSEEVQAEDVQNEVLSQIQDTAPSGSFYRHPREFIEEHKKEILRWLKKPEAREELYRIYPPFTPKLER